MAVNVTATVQCGYGFIVLHAGGIQLAHAVPREIAESLIAREAAVAELTEAAKELADFWNHKDGGRSVGLRVARVNAALARINGETT